MGEWELISSGKDVTIFAVGRMVQLAMQATIELMGKGISAGVVDARFVAPMDRKLLLEQEAGGHGGGQRVLRRLRRGRSGDAQ